MDSSSEERKYQKLLREQAEEYASYITEKLGENIAAIILFGSLAKNNATTMSDIDILLIHFGNDAFEDQLDAETFNFMMKTGAPIECLFYKYFDMKYNPSYFLKYNLEHGVVLFMKNKSALKRKEITGYLELSDTFEEDARACFDNKRFRATIDLGYNSIELKIKALLLMKLDELPSSHGGLISKFGEIYITPKKVNEKIGKKLHKALRLRNMARYDPQAEFTSDHCSQILTLITELSDLIDFLLNFAV